MKNDEDEMARRNNQQEINHKRKNDDEDEMARRNNQQEINHKRKNDDEDEMVRRNNQQEINHKRKNDDEDEMARRNNQQEINHKRKNDEDQDLNRQITSTTRLSDGGQEDDMLALRLNSNWPSLPRPIVRPQPQPQNPSQEPLQLSNTHPLYRGEPLHVAPAPFPPPNWLNGGESSTAPPVRAAVQMPHPQPAPPVRAAVQMPHPQPAPPVRAAVQMPHPQPAPPVRAAVQTPHPQPAPPVRAAVQMPHPQPAPPVRAAVQMPHPQPPPPVRAAVQMPYPQPPPPVRAAVQFPHPQPPPPVRAAVQMSYPQPPPPVRAAVQFPHPQPPPPVRAAVQIPPPQPAPPVRAAVQIPPPPVVYHHDAGPRAMQMPHPPATVFRPVRARRNPTQVPGHGKSEIVPAPFPWATTRRATVHSLQYLVSHNIFTIKGDVQCKRCERQYEIEYNLQDKFVEVGTYIVENRRMMHDRAPDVWKDPVLPACKYCEQENSAKPIVADKKRAINWLFLLLGQMLGCCTLEQLKYFCKHTKNHRTGAKDRVLYLTYLCLCKQLDPNGPFDVRN